MLDLSFDVVEVSTLGPEARFDLWAKAMYIVGVHHAGMTTMIMMPPGSNYTEISGMSGETSDSVPNLGVERVAIGAVQVDSLPLSMP